MITILGIACIFLLLIVGLLRSDRKYLLRALDEARADRAREAKRTSDLRAEYIAASRKNTETLNATTARLHAMNRDVVPDLIRDLNNATPKEA